MLDLLQNSSTRVGAELARITNVKSEGTKVFHLDGAAAVQFSHPLKTNSGEMGREGEEGGEGRDRRKGREYT